MNMRRQLHTLIIKNDSSFNTLSKKALAQIILKIVYLKRDGATMKLIRAEIANVIVGSVPHTEIDAALRYLVQSGKLNPKNGKYFIKNTYQAVIEKSESETEELLQYVLKKYFEKAESDKDAVRNWFQDTTIKFFETFSFEWFHQVTYKTKSAINPLNLRETLTGVLNSAKGILENDKEWLRGQYNKFIASEEPRESLLFWQYGISMFSSRLITAKNYADALSLDTFRDSKFILDTNLLMILDLEAHEHSNSLKALEDVLIRLNIRPAYFPTTRAEYLRAMTMRKTETINVFDNYSLSVLSQSDCPFIQTALKRGCANEQDLNRMFNQLLDLPEKFHEKLDIDRCEYAELEEEIEKGQQDEELKSTLNEVYKKKTNRDKRERPIIHDAGMIAGTKYLRQSEKCWILTNDSTLKRYATEYVVRDETPIAIGLDVIIGVMAISNGGVNVEASNFAPLFKNLVKQSLLPESNAFELQDFAFPP